MAAKEKVKALMADGHNVVVSDARFANEIEMGLQLGGKCLLMAHRDGDLIPDANAHASENEFFGYAHKMTIMASTSIAEMQQKIDKFI